MTQTTGHKEKISFTISDEAETKRMLEKMEMLTIDYLQLLNNKQLNKKYRDCLGELINNIIVNNPENIETILLYGGVVRDSKFFDEWSDIDIIIVFKDITKRSAINFAEIIQQLETRYSIRIDLTQISLEQLTDERLTKCYFNSEIINALSMRENVSIVVFGRLPNVSCTSEQEKQAAVFYMVNTLTLFRRYLVEVLYRGDVEEHIKEDLKRIIRWTFSIIRASLRLFNIYTHPYEYTLPFVKQTFPEVDTSLLKQLINIRENINTVDDSFEFFQMLQKLEIFIEKYVTLSLRRYADGIERNK